MGFFIKSHESKYISMIVFSKLIENIFIRYQIDEESFNLVKLFLLPTNELIGL